MPADDIIALRLDKWLWAARFFKTRAMAGKLISGGRLRIDGDIMSKPHRQARPGMVLTFPQGNANQDYPYQSLSAISPTSS